MPKRLSKLYQTREATTFGSLSVSQVVCYFEYRPVMLASEVAMELPQLFSVRVIKWDIS